MTPVAPQDIPKHWERVKQGLEVIRKKTGEPWTELNVLQALVNCNAALFIDDRGFAVLQLLREDWTNEPFMNVWCFFYPRAAKQRRAELFAFFDEQARRAGVSHWKFASPLMGWKAVEGECEVERVVYRRRMK